MQILINPQKPHFYEGQPFTIEVKISGLKYPIHRLTAQLFGRIKSLNPANLPVLYAVTDTKFDPENPIDFAGIVMSDTHQIIDSITADSTYALSICASGIPPSYEGIGSILYYELQLSFQAGGRIDKSHVFPVNIIRQSNENNFILKQIQSNAKIEFTSKETKTRQSIYNQLAPNQVERALCQRYTIENERGDPVATVEMSNQIFAGGDLDGYIDLKNVKTLIQGVRINFSMQEKYRDVVTTVMPIAQGNIWLVGTLNKKFTVPVPALATPPFSTDFVDVSYVVEFIFTAPSGIWKWEMPIEVLPPQFSLTPPRVY